VSRLGGGFHVAQVAVEVGGLDDDRGGLCIDPVEDIALAIGRSRQADEIVAVAEVAANHVAVVRVEAAGEQDAVAPGQATRHQHSFSRRRGAVIHRGVGDLHAEKMGDLGLELEQHLQGALRHLRLVGRVGCKPLGPLDQVIDRGGHVVAIGTGTDEEWAIGAGAIFLRERPHMRLDDEFGRMGGEI
jgi:hypothetical protein